MPPCAVMCAGASPQHLLRDAPWMPPLRTSDSPGSTAETACGWSAVSGARSANVLAVMS
ncbi:hypothetical protein OEIGOIKO_05356 [Streptomyces chrestomyceticus JCM 4735]|uniref:Uncharacterized protein n=1 Tax=Streptomyces chrestomyceticus JCM 4735 TaxID=1306181 RepID=A0A7U9KZE7_9ACTN|nr:hypothetical protein OEIGOIKO_05356 [Streptomyces chrestomyceticus JCM 4735]